MNQDLLSRDNLSLKEIACLLFFMCIWHRGSCSLVQTLKEEEENSLPGSVKDVFLLLYLLIVYSKCVKKKKRKTRYFGFKE